MTSILALPRVTRIVLATAVFAAGSARAFDLNWNLQPTLMAQVDYDAHATEPESFDGFQLQRLRLGLRAAPAPWLLAVAVFQYEDDKVTPFEVYLQASPAQSWHLSVGYRRTPLFSSAKDELIESLPIPELSLVTRALWPGVDLGAEVHYTPDTLPLEGWLRFGNGSQSAAGNDGPYPAVDARIDTVLGRARPGRDDSWGLRLGVGEHAKYRENTTALSDTTPDGFLFFHPVATDGWQTVEEAHVGAWLGSWNATLEGGIAREDRSEAPAGSTAPRTRLQPVYTAGVSLEVAWMIFGAPRTPGRAVVPGIWPNADTSSLDDWHGGSVEVAARVERVDLEYGATDVHAGGAEGGAIAVNWWATPYTAFSLAAYDYHYLASPIEEPNQSNFWLIMARTTISFR